ncbi:hypothetical protein D3C72_2160560 [compost metagenome]
MPCATPVSLTMTMEPTPVSPISVSTASSGSSARAVTGGRLHSSCSLVAIDCCSSARCENCACICLRDWLSRVEMWLAQKRLNTGLISSSCWKSWLSSW